LNGLCAAALVLAIAALAPPRARAQEAAPAQASAPAGPGFAASLPGIGGATLPDVGSVTAAPAAAGSAAPDINAAPASSASPPPDLGDSIRKRAGTAEAAGAAAASSPAAAPADGSALEAGAPASGAPAGSAAAAGAADAAAAGASTAGAGVNAPAAGAAASGASSGGAVTEAAVMPPASATKPGRGGGRRARSAAATAPAAAGGGGAGSAGSKDASAQPGNPFSAMQLSAGHGPIDIKSDTLELDYKNNIVIFRGQVHAVQADALLTSDSLKVLYGKDFHEVKQMFADGNVRMSQGTRWATGDHAVLDQAAHTVVLTGNPVVHDGEDQVAGIRITVHLDSGKSEVQGARAVLFPKQRQTRDNKGAPAAHQS
jgi:lipopolysaccharide transport protein LptA